MSIDIKKIDLILQYALLVAGEQDDFVDRQLGPIHLIKYVYLADLAYAESNDGQIFTGVDWQFYKFGPWSQIVNERIEPALFDIGADKKVFPSNYEDKDEWIRWQPVDDTKMPTIERELPFIISSVLRKYIRQFGKYTPELLAYVYSTSPMLLAAPHEYLDFSHLRNKKKNIENDHVITTQLTKKKKKELKEKMRNLRAMSKERLIAKRQEKKFITPPISPRYDNVYFDGIEWLDSLAGPEIPQGKKEVMFSDSLWKSPARRGGDVSD